MAAAGQIQFYTREQVLSGVDTSGVPTLSGATDISFLSLDNSINSVTTDFVVEGLEVGMFIEVSGSGNNDKRFVLKEVTAHKLIVIDECVTPEDAGETVVIGPAYVLVANQGQTQAKLGERSFICTVCGGGFPESQMRKFRGKYYCVPNEDYKDIASILKTEYARRHKPAGLGSERIVLPIVKG